jgi:hypothetical protein
MSEHKTSKLPQARKYLRPAQWGFDELLAKRLSDTAFVFYLVGILASLRAVQHALKSADSTLSEEHKRVIDEWWQATPLSTPELHFIRTSRNLLLKAGAFPAFAIYTESSIGEGSNLQITGTSYDWVKAGQSFGLKPLALAAKPACVSWVARAKATSGVICATIETSPGPCPSTSE